MIIVPIRFLRESLALIVMIALACNICARASDAKANEKSDGVSVETYGEVLDLVFPRTVRDFRHTSYVLFLRYLPSSTTESQIAIYASRDGSFEVYTYNLASGSPRVLTQCDDYADKTGREEPSELASQIKVEVMRIDLPTPTVRQLVARFVDLKYSPFLASRRALQGTEGVYVDRPAYQLWFETNYSNLQVSLSTDTADYEQRNHPLVQWMDDVKAAVEGARRKD